MKNFLETKDNLLLLAAQNLKNIRTWRNLPNDNNIFSEGNHIYLKSTLYLILASYISKDIDYSKFNKILMGNILSRISLYDINVNINKNIKENDIIKYINSFYKKNNVDLSEDNKRSIEYYYNNSSIEKELWNFISLLINKFEYEKIIKRNENIIPRKIIDDIYSNFNEWEIKTNKIKKYLLSSIKINEKMFNIYIDEIIKILLTNTYQYRFNGFAMKNKISIAEHQILVYFIYNILFERKINNKEKMRKKNVFFQNIMVVTLFHDIVEGFTKDINSPLKKEIPNLSNLLKAEEEKYLKVFLETINSNEFNKNLPLLLNPFEKTNKYSIINKKELKFADDYSAFIEMLIEKYVYNNSNIYIQKAIKQLMQKYQKEENYYKILLKTLFNLKNIEKEEIINYESSILNSSF